MWLARFGARVPFAAKLLPPLRAWASSREVPKPNGKSFRATYRGNVEGGR